uniref:Uncharacterized protein n=1 Tax=Arundo donax TaxID=35708 RepID=A0A0A8Z953_ARUDO
MTRLIADTIQEPKLVMVAHIRYTLSVEEFTKLSGSARLKAIHDKVFKNMLPSLGIVDR